MHFMSDEKTHETVTATKFELDSVVYYSSVVYVCHRIEVPIIEIYFCTQQFL